MARQEKGGTCDVDNIVGGYQDRLVINVRTVPNGYTLDIEAGEKKYGYMYFNPYKLLDGFMYHVGLVELGEVSEEFREKVLKAAVAWQDNGELVKLRSNLFALLCKEPEIRGGDCRTEIKSHQSRKEAEEESQGC